MDDSTLYYQAPQLVLDDSTMMESIIDDDIEAQKNNIEEFDQLKDQEPPSLVVENNDNIIEEFDDNNICMRMDSFFYKETYTRENIFRFIIPVCVFAGCIGWLLWFTTL